MQREHTPSPQSGTAPPPGPATPPPAGRETRGPSGSLVGLLLGPVLLILVMLVPAPEGMPQAAWRTAAVGLMMATWWVTEAIPIPATALLPLALFPVFGILTISETAAPYGNPVIYLFLGGFLLALALERCGLHRRLALGIIGLVGARPVDLVAGFMLATALLSMWVSNTATVVMMLPIAISIIALVQEQASGGTGGANFGIALLLGIAYAASIGGVGTLIGTPPNALLAAFMLEVYDVRIGFAQWMLFGVPIVLVALPLTWLLLTRFAFPVSGVELTGGAEMIARERAALGRMTSGERRVAVIVGVVALAWTTQPLLARVIPGLSDTGIAIAGAMLLFVTPLGSPRGEFALDWKQAERLPWGVLVLFGGGLSLAAAIQSTGLAGWIGAELTGLRALPLVVVTLMVTAVIVFLTELTSNTATAAAFLPVVASTAIALGADPLLLAVPAAVGASCAFMLPVATPPNALVYAGGQVSIRQMIRAGFWLNLIMIALLILAVFTLGPLVLPGLRGP